MIIGGIIVFLGSILVAWTGWIFTENATKEGGILFGIGVLGAMYGAFLTIVGLGGWISGAV